MKLATKEANQGHDLGPFYRNHLKLIHRASEIISVMVKWFVSDQDVILGPYSTEELKTGIKRNEIPEAGMVWGRPLFEDWRSVNWWTQNVNSLLESFGEKDNNKQWHFTIHGHSKGPLSRDELIENLKASKDKKDALIWTHGMKSWASILEFHDMMDAVGIGRRQFPRREISGNVIADVDGVAQVGKLDSISAGGCGVTQLKGLLPGEVVPIEIKSDYLTNTIHVNVEVRYVSQSGYVGMKFRGIHPEAQSTIIDYVRGNTAKRAA